MYINTETSVKLSHSALQNRLNTSFPRDKPPDGWEIYVSPPAPVDIKTVRLAAISTINQHYQSKADAEAGKYPDFEVVTWADQEAEALVYQAWDGTGAAPDTPLLSGIATARGLSVTDLATRVIANATAWRSLAPVLIGERQAKIDAVALAATPDEINQVLFLLHQ